LWLAEAEAELGLPITPAQIAELRDHVDTIDFSVADKYERQLRHDVMAHVHAYGDQCPAARPIIHLGATSCYVTDNGDLILLREALALLCRRVASVIDALAKFAVQHRDLATLSFTHLQPAQPTTVGRRACLWAYDLALDLAELERRCAMLRARSVKGTTGTQASFLELFQGDHAKVRRLERLIAEKMGFASSYAITGQTYPRKVGCERMGGLARFVLSLQSSPNATLAGQWMERTLDDSANRRLVLPQAFLAVDAILLLYRNVAEGLVVYPEVIAKNLREELPFMATENILMAAVAAGGDRQDLHERIRQHSQQAAAEVKQHGRANDLLARLAADPAFAGVDLEAAADAQTLVGRGPQQVDEFILDVVAPIRAQYPDGAGPADSIRV
jgi:adenylosuccinate lyase